MVGVPSFQETVRRGHITSQTNLLVYDLNLARSEALKRSVQVTVQRTGANWENGWQVFADPNGNGTADTGDDVIHIFEGLSDGFTLRSGANFSDWVAFLPNGFSQGSGSLNNDTFRLCDDNQVASEGRSIVINVAGRIRMAQGTASCP